MQSHSLLFCYAVGIAIASLLGGMLPLSKFLTHQRLQLAISFVGGVMLGIGVLHLLPHSLGGAISPESSMYYFLFGLLAMFFLERFFSFHQHEVPSEDLKCNHDPHHNHKHGIEWGGALVGLSVHGVCGGIALAASVLQHSTHGTGHEALPGLGTFLAIALHKPFDSFTLSALMSRGNWTKGFKRLVNVGFASVVPIGILLVVLGTTLAPVSEATMSMMLAFSAGVFVCIALSDLLPELQFHKHDRVSLSVALCAGVLLAWVIEQLEHLFG